ncbi:MAG TPA: plasmid replication protein, CyRepA1 family [Rhizomicrobium sp.]|jgi:hypothetical protein
MKLSINPTFHNKTTPTKRAYAEGWIPVDLNADQLAWQINQGHAFSAQFKEEYRKSSNFVAADFIAADIDGTMSLADALANPFVTAHATIVYTTPSHGVDGEDRFRIIFQLPTTIESASLWSAALTGLASRLGADKKATDGARLFFGSEGSAPKILGGTLTDAVVEELISEGQIIRQAARRGEGSAASSDASFQARRTVSRDLDILCADGSTRKLQDLPRNTRVHCPFHTDRKPSAFVLTSTKGSPGIRCASCMQTFWIEGRAAKPYDYYEFEKDTISLEAESEPPAHNSLRDWLFGTPLPDLPSRTAKIFNSKRLPPIFQPRGVALIRSPKGSGKTYNIEGIVQSARNRRKSVLLIGHRRTLLRELSKRLGLKCYLDDEERHFDPVVRLPPKKAIEKRRKWSQAKPDYYAISIDSLATRLPEPRKYDVVIIDECEQVLSHVCSKTIEHPGPILKVLQHYITNAETLYMFDADLNSITTGFVRRCRALRSSDGVGDPTLQVLNTYQEDGRACYVFEEETDLLDDVLASAQEGKRLFVACNSKRRAEGIEKWLKDEVPEIRTLLVTADDKDTSAVREFLGNVGQEFLKYDAIVASPAIGTGIDISFPNDDQCVDVVYGFFDSQINTHYEIDQQLGRVRNPGAVKVWISDEEEYFETDPEAIKLELIQTGKVNDAITGYEADGTIVYDAEHPLLNLQAETYAAVRASLNKLRYYFLEHKKHNGWAISNISKRSNDDRDDPLSESYVQVDEIRTARILAAAKIDRRRYDELLAARESGEAIGVNSRFELVRYEIEFFYGKDVTADLVALDDGGRYREQIERYEELALHKDFVEIEHRLALFWSDSDWISAFSNQTDNLLDALFIASGLVCKDGFLTEKQVSTGVLESFTALCRDRAKSLEMEYGIRLRKDFERKPMRTLSELLRLVGLSLEMAAYEKIRGKRIYYYQIAGERLETLQSIVSHRKVVAAERKKDDVERISDRYRAKGKQQGRRQAKIEDLFPKPNAQSGSLARDADVPDEDWLLDAISNQ